MSARFIATLATGLCLTAIGFGQQPAKTKSIWDGVYSEAQAKRGLTAYNSHCSGCHGADLGGLGGVLIGSKFMDRWREDKLSNFYKLIRNTMPPGPRDRLSDAQYVDIVAYVLKRNEFPSGATGFQSTDFDGIQVVGKDGPAPVPDFSLVTVVGCLARDASNVWMLTSASEPVRTRNPRESTEAEFAQSKERSAGTHNFRFLTTYDFAEEFKVGRWMEAKGFLIRSPGNDKINVTWLKGLRETCENH
jgi:mono/diheme cytochrome c family protein